MGEITDVCEGTGSQNGEWHHAKSDKEKGWNEKTRSKGKGVVCRESPERSRCPYRATPLFRQVTDSNKEKVLVMVESRTPLELGIAFARMYLEQEFGYGSVELIEPPVLFDE